VAVGLSEVLGKVFRICDFNELMLASAIVGSVMACSAPEFKSSPAAASPPPPSIGARPPRRG
jgi:hypothetical protein